MEPSQNVKRYWAFAVPFFTMTIPNFQPLNGRLIAELNSSRPVHRGSHLHANRYENTWVDLEHVPSASAVFDFAESVASEMLNRPLIIPRERGGDWFWFNEMQIRGGVTSLHNHWSARGFFSGCYYIRVPPGSGNLVFSRARSQTLGNPQLQESNFFAEVEVTPTEGMLVLFPSWQDHLVRPNQTDESRISLAFNLRQADGKAATFVTGAVIQL